MGTIRTGWTKAADADWARTAATGVAYGDGTLNLDFSDIIGEHSLGFNLMKIDPLF
jgi:hypothetical protein